MSCIFQANLRGFSADTSYNADYGIKRMYSCVIKSSAGAAEASGREERGQNTSQIPQRKEARPSLTAGDNLTVQKRRPGKQVLCGLSCILLPGGGSWGKRAIRVPGREAVSKRKESSSLRACSSPGI